MGLAAAFSSKKLEKIYMWIYTVLYAIARMQPVTTH
jgi:hypothetical protein